MDTFKHKTLSVLIPTIAAYLGFQALDYALQIYQIETYFALAWYVFAFHVFWLAFIFDLHLKGIGQLNSIKQDIKGAKLLWTGIKNRIRHFYHWPYLRHFLNYLILPTVIYWSVIVLMFLNVFDEAEKNIIVILATASLAVIYWFFKDAFNHIQEVRHTGIKVLGLAKLFTAYLAVTSVIGIGWYYGLSLTIILPVIYFVIFMLVYQALVQHRLLTLHNIAGILMVGILVALAFAVVYQKWDVNYYTAGLIVSVVYNAAWGVLHKYADKQLTSKIFWEYVFMMVFLVSVIVSTHSFNGRI